MTSIEDLAIDRKQLGSLITMANNQGASLQVRKHKKYPYIICGTDTIGRCVKMGGTAEWLYDELMKTLTDYLCC